MSCVVRDVVVVGAGNVGLAAVLTLAAALKRTRGRALGHLEVVDFDRVGPRDVRKGHLRRCLGAFKAEAAKDAVRRFFGRSAAERVRPVVAAAQSVPGLLRERAVFIGCDSLGDAAWISEQCDSWHCRLSTGVFRDAPAHTVEVFPARTPARLGDLYDVQAWRDAATRRDCLSGVPVAQGAGTAQPQGWLSAALAVESFLARSGQVEPYLVRAQGGRVESARIQETAIDPGTPPLATIILSEGNDLTLQGVFDGAARASGHDPQNLALRFPVPFVTRFEPGARGLIHGFERYPITGVGPNDAPSILLRASTLLGVRDAQSFGASSLAALGAPAGMDIMVLADGPRLRLRIPFRRKDIPALASIPKDLTEEGSRSATA